MSMQDDRRDDDTLAGEYALGLLEGDERAAFEARLKDEADLRRRVRDWSERLSRLSGDVAPVAPPDRIKEAIETRLFGDGAEGKRRSWARRWLLLLGGLGAAAAMIGILIFGGILSETDQLVAEIAAPDRSVIVDIQISPAREGKEIIAEITSGGPRPDRALELWLIADGAEQPVSLGLLARADVVRLPLSAAQLRLLPGATLAISDEPPGGSPTGLPTGDVLGTGVVIARSG